MNTIQDSVIQAMEAEQKYLAELLEVLTFEQRALIEDEFQSLADCIQKKAELINKINLIDIERANSLSQLGFNNDTDGIEKWLSQCEESVQFCWKEILKLSELAKQQNQLNGGLISRRMAINQAGLNVLHQANPAGALYGPSGQSMTPSGQGKGFTVG